MGCNRCRLDVGEMDECHLCDLEMRNLVENTLFQNRGRETISTRISLEWDQLKINVLRQTIARHALGRTSIVHCRAFPFQMEIPIVDTTLHSRRGYNFGGKHFINIWRGDILFEIIFLEKDQPEDSWFVGRRLRRDCYNHNNFLWVFPSVRDWPDYSLSISKRLRMSQ